MALSYAEINEIERVLGSEGQLIFGGVVAVHFSQFDASLNKYKKWTATGMEGALCLIFDPLTFAYTFMLFERDEFELIYEAPVTSEMRYHEMDVAFHTFLTDSGIVGFHFANTQVSKDFLAAVQGKHVENRIGTLQRAEEKERRGVSEDLDFEEKTTEPVQRVQQRTQQREVAPQPVGGLVSELKKRLSFRNKKKASDQSMTQRHNNNKPPVPPRKQEDAAPRSVSKRNSFRRKADLVHATLAKGAAVAKKSPPSLPPRKPSKTKAPPPAPPRIRKPKSREVNKYDEGYMDFDYETVSVTDSEVSSIASVPPPPGLGPRHVGNKVQPGTHFMDINYAEDRESIPPPPPPVKPEHMRAQHKSAREESMVNGFFPLPPARPASFLPWP